MRRRTVFVDIDPATFTMDPDAIARAITPRTKAIIAVHQMGMPCDLARIVPIARARKAFPSSRMPPARLVRKFCITAAGNRSAVRMAMSHASRCIHAR